MSFNPTQRPNWTSSDNPRRQKNLRRKERGPVMWEVGNAEISEEAGVQEAAIRTALPLRTRTLRAVVEYVMSRWWKRSRRLTDAEVRENLGADYEKWEKRYPRFDLWTCGVRDCDELRLERGFCAKHGGAPLVDFDADLCFKARVGDRWMLLGRLMAGAPEGRFVSHLDGNRWNCRPDNLRIETPEAWTERRRQSFLFRHPDLLGIPSTPRADPMSESPTPQNRDTPA